MGQRANSNRNAQLDAEKERGAGRRKTRSPEREAIKDAMDPVPMKGKTGGARGKDNRAERRGIGSASQGAGGGGGAQSRAKANSLTTGRSTRPARKRGTAASAGRRGATAR